MNQIDTQPRFSILRYEADPISGLRFPIAVIVYRADTCVTITASKLPSVDWIGEDGVRCIHHKLMRLAHTQQIPEGGLGVGPNFTWTAPQIAVSDVDLKWAEALLPRAQDKTVRSSKPKATPKPDFPPFEVEEAVFRENHALWKTTHLGEWVAIDGTTVIGFRQDLSEAVMLAISTTNRLDNFVKKIENRVREFVFI